MAVVVANKDIEYDKKHNNTKYSEGLHTIEMFPALLVGLFMILFGVVIIIG
jgi:Co/Zn/Cd efflux system component